MLRKTLNLCLGRETLSLYSKLYQVCLHFVSPYFFSTCLLFKHLNSIDCVVTGLIVVVEDKARVNNTWQVTEIYVHEVPQGCKPGLEPTKWTNLLFLFMHAMVLMAGCYFNMSPIYCSQTLGNSMSLQISRKELPCLGLSKWKLVQTEMDSYGFECLSDDDRQSWPW